MLYFHTNLVQVILYDLIVIEEIVVAGLMNAIFSAFSPIDNFDAFSPEDPANKEAVRRCGESRTS